MWRNRYKFQYLVIISLLSLVLTLGCSSRSTPSVTSGVNQEINISLPGNISGTILVTDQGKLLKKAQITSSDGNISLSIDAGTTLLDNNNKPLQSIKVAIDSSIPIPPQNVVMIGNMIEIQPLGANINPSLRLALKYDPSLLPQEVNENELWISNYTGNSWEMVRYKNIDTGANQVTTKISRFGRYSILSPTTPRVNQPGPTSGNFLEALHNGKPTLAEFGSSTCIPCKQMRPILEQLSADYEDKLNVTIVEIYEEREVTRLFQILTIPTQIIFDINGNEVTRHIGVWEREQIEAELAQVGVQ
jgi:thioredoxin 1